MTTVLERTPLERLLRRCVGDGVITPDQAERIRAYAADGAPATSRNQFVAEGLGYLGGAIVLAGSVLVGARYWSDLDTGWRLAVLVTGALVLLGSGWIAGTAMPEASRAVGGRLQAVLWLVSLGCSAGALGVLGQALGLDGQSIPLLIGAGCASYALCLWLAHRTVLQQIALMVSVALAAAGALIRIWEEDDLPGLGVWAVGLGWIVLGRTGVLSPRRLTLVLGSAMAIFGAMLTAGTSAGMVLTLVTVAAVVVGSILLRDLALLAVGAIGTVANVPMAMTTWFPDSIAAAIGLVVAGVVLVVTAVTIAVRGHRVE